MSNEVEIVVRSRDQSAPSIDAAKTRLRELAAVARTVPSDIRVKAQADIAQAQAKLETLAAQRVKVNVDTAAVERKLERLRVLAREATGDKKVKVDADIAQAEAKLLTLRARKVKIDVDTGAATAKIAALALEINRLPSPLERLRDKLQEVKTKGFSPLITAALSLGPAILPVAAQAVTIVGSLANSLAGAGAAAGVFGAVVKSSFADIQEAAKKTDDLQGKIRLLDREIKQSEPGSKDQIRLLKERAKATQELNARMADLDPTTRRTVQAFQGVKQAWSNFKDDNKGTVDSMLTRVFDVVKEVIPKLQPLFDAGATAADKLIKVFERKVQDGGVERLIKYLADHAKGALSDVIGIFMGLARALGNFMKATDDGGGALRWVRTMVDKLADFSKSKAFTDFLEWVRGNGKQVGEMFKNIADAALKIAKAAGPLAPISLAIATALTTIINLIPQPVLTFIIGAIIAWSVATKALAVAQIALNLAMDANPIGVVILIIAALIAIIVVIVQHWDFFKHAAQVAWNAVKNAAGAAIHWLQDRWHQFSAWLGTIWGRVKSLGSRLWDTVKSAVTSAVHWVQNKWNGLMGWLSSLPGRVTGAVSGMWDGIKNGFRSAINTVIGWWNNLSFTMPSIDEGPVHIGGWTLGTPDIPYMAKGGIFGGSQSNLAVVGEHGRELVRLPVGSNVMPNGQTESMLSSGGGPARVVLEINSGGSAMDDLLVQILRKAIRVRGGTVQDALGR